MTTLRFGLEFAGREQVVASLHDASTGTLGFDGDRSIRTDRAEHVFIEGDNLEVLRQLRVAYFGRVQLIYIDPPYNTGQDFVYRDRYHRSAAEFLRSSGQVGDEGERWVVNPSTAGRYHADWLSMMYPRLWLARQFLRDDGLFMCSIDDHEVHHLRVVLDEIFGEDCFIAQIVVTTNPGGRDYLRIATAHEYLLVYGARPDAPIRQEPRPRASGSVHEDVRGRFELRELRNRNPKFHPDNRPNLYYPLFVRPEPEPDALCAVALHEGDGFTVRVEPCNRLGQGSVWRWGKSKVAAAMGVAGSADSEVVARRRRDGQYNIYEKYRSTTRRPRSIWDDPAFRSECGTSDLKSLLEEAVFDHPKPVAFIRRCIELGCDDDGWVLDFFAGSGTTGQAVIEQNEADRGRRRFIGIQIAEPVPSSSAAHHRGLRTIAEIAAKRLAACLDQHPEQGLRWFRVESLPSRAWLSDATNAAAYLAGLHAQVAERQSEPSHPWACALAQGFTLAATIVVPDYEGWLVVREDDDGERWLAIEGEGGPVPELPDGAILAVGDTRLDDPAIAELAPRYRIVRR